MVQQFKARTSKIRNGCKAEGKMSKTVGQEFPGYRKLLKKGLHMLNILKLWDLDNSKFDPINVPHLFVLVLPLFQEDEHSSFNVMQ